MIEILCCAICKYYADGRCTKDQEQTIPDFYCDDFEGGQKHETEGQA